MVNFLKKKAITLLAIREYSRKELFYKLKVYTDEDAQIYMVLDELKDLGYLSEERFTESYVNSYQKKYGSLRIKYGLRNKGIDDELALQYLKEINRHDELNIATNLFIKKLGNNEISSKIIIRGVRFLLNRGFDMEIISGVLKKLQLKI